MVTVTAKYMKKCTFKRNVKQYWLFEHTVCRAVQSIARRNLQLVIIRTDVFYCLDFLKHVVYIIICTLRYHESIMRIILVRTRSTPDMSSNRNKIFCKQSRFILNSTVIKKLPNHKFMISLICIIIHSSESVSFLRQIAQNPIYITHLAFSTLLWRIWMVKYSKNYIQEKI